MASLSLGRDRGVWTAATFVVVTLTLGQAFLLLLGPLTRANGTFTRSVGIAIIAPDSRYYLRPSGVLEVLALPWTRWGYPLLLSLGGGGLETSTLAVFINFVAVSGAAYLMFRVVDAQAGAISATAAVSVLLLNPMTAQWFRIVMTESVFFAIVITATALGHRVLTGELNRLGPLALSFVAVLAAITRPNGFLVAASVASLYLVGCTEGRRRIALLALLWTAAFGLAPIAFSSTGPPAEGTITSQLYGGVVVEGADHVRVTIAMPPPLDAGDESMRAAALYAASHPIATARLGTARLTMETAQVRRHYPPVVNLGFGLAMLVFFTASVAGWRDPRSRTAKTVFVTLSAPLLLLTMATFAVAEGRYGWAYLLPLAPIAGIGIDRIVASLAPGLHRRFIPPGTAP
jgi:4-amino-4-deoxy-L-arabinose transferase-like glycosyltransferase